MAQQDKIAKDYLEVETEDLAANLAPASSSPAYALAKRLHGLSIAWTQNCVKIKTEHKEAFVEFIVEAFAKASNATTADITQSEIIAKLKEAKKISPDATMATIIDQDSVITFVNYVEGLRYFGSCSNSPHVSDLIIKEFSWEYPFTTQDREKVIKFAHVLQVTITLLRTLHRQNPAQVLKEAVKYFGGTYILKEQNYYPLQGIRDVIVLGAFLKRLEAKSSNPSATLEAIAVNVMLNLEKQAKDTQKTTEKS